MKKSTYILYGIGIAFIILNLFGLAAYFFLESGAAHILTVIWTIVFLLLGVVMGVFLILFANARQDIADINELLSLSLGRNHKAELALEELRQELLKLKARLPDQEALDH